MKYQFEYITKTKAKVTLIPETDIDKKLLETLNPENPEDEMTFYHHFEKGVQKFSASAVFLGIDKFIRVPDIAICNFEVAIGF